MPTRSARAKRQTRSEKLDLRLTSAAKRRLQVAAEAEKKSLTEFVLESALMRADESLADRRHFTLSAKDWTEFMKALDAPPRDHPRLRRLLQEPSVFDSSED